MNTRSTGRSGPDRPRVEDLGGGVFGYIQPDGGWWISNAGFLVGSQGVVGVDTAATTRRTLALRVAIRRTSDRPVRTLVNTHHHGDHTYGNDQFPEATIVGHRQCREQLIASGPPGPAQSLTWDVPDWGTPRVAAPFLTYTDSVDVWVDDLCCEVRYIGAPAHTTNDSVVWIAERRILFSGDLVMNGGTPFVLGGSLAGSLAAVDQLRSLQPETIIPGHGDVCGPEVLDQAEGYLRFVQDYARDSLAAGHTPLEAARAADLGPYAALGEPERLVANLHRAYAELDPTGATTVDRRAALADMVALNGNRPLSCHA